MSGFILFSLAVFMLFPVRQDNKTGAELYRIVQGIEGLHDAARLDFIKAELKNMKVSYTTMPFDTMVSRRGGERRVSGENIVVRMGSGAKHIVVGAHSDAVPNAPGANDNGGGVAVVLGLIKSLKDYQWNVTADFCFFDREENGLVGSAVFVREYRDKQRHLAMVNLDVAGTGEEVYIGPVGGGDDDLLMPLARKAAKLNGYTLQERALYPGSDHMSFMGAKLENISISIAPKGDADKIVDLLSGKKPTEETFPEILKVMHTPQDSAVYVSPTALNMSYEFTRSLIRQLNESQK